MGQVYKVRNILSNRMEAMKVLLPNLEGDPGLGRPFPERNQGAATLDHPNIAKLHTAMRAGNQLVMVMEFVDGTSLSQVLQRGPLPPSAAAAYAAEYWTRWGTRTLTASFTATSSPPISC